MPAIAAAPLFWGSVAAAGSAVAGGALAAHASSSAADKQTAAANRAAELQKQTADETLAFQKEQAAQDAARYEAAQRGNYNQYVSRVKGAQNLGRTIGFDLPDAAEYVSATGAPAAGGSSASSGVDPKLQAAIADYQAKNPASNGIAGLTAALKSQGFNVDRYMYDKTPSNNELNIGGQKYKVLGGEDSPTSAYWYKPGMNDSAPGRGALPNSIGSYVGATGAPGMNYAAYTPQVQPFALRSINAFLR